jgi:hypothetical protein
MDECGMATRTFSFFICVGPYRRAHAPSYAQKWIGEETTEKRVLAIFHGLYYCWAVSVEFEAVRAGQVRRFRRTHQVNLSAI